MGIPSFDRGDRVRLGNPTGTNDDGSVRLPFRNIAGVDTDPTTVTLRILKPSGAVLVYGWPASGVDGTLTRELLGRFYQDVTLDEAGTWSWQLRGTGAVETSEEGKLHVRWSPFP